MADRSAMINSRWFLPLILLVLAGCSALPDFGPLPESPLLRSLERKSGLIVYIGGDGNVYTIDQGGGNQIAITSDAEVSQSGGVLRFYQFPAWSWDNQRIAFIGYDLSGGGEESNLYIADAEGKERVELFSSSSEIPFYVYWAPNNERLGFLTSAESTGNMILRTSNLEEGEARITDVGGLYYWSWSPDSQYLIAHVGGPVESDPNTHLAFLSVSQEVWERRLSLIPGNFQSPVWSPQGDRVLLATRRPEGGGVLMFADLNGEPIQELATYESYLSFGWSPDGKQIATLGSTGNSAQAGGPLTIFPVDQPDKPLVTLDEQVLAFFWAPDSKKIAYLVAQAPSNEAEGTAQGDVPALHLRVLEIAGAKTRTIATFRPTPQFSAMLPIFDQYQRSNTLWSPNSEYLVLSALNQDNEAGIWVVPASGRLPPRFITPGFIAFWSWK